MDMDDTPSEPEKPTENKNAKPKRSSRSRRKEEKACELENGKAEVGSVLAQARNALDAKLLDKCMTKPTESDAVSEEQMRKNRDASAARAKQYVEKMKSKGAKEQRREKQEKQKASRHDIDQDEFMEMVKKGALQGSQCQMEIRVEAVGVTAKCSVTLKKGHKEGKIGTVKAEKEAKTMICRGDTIVGFLKVDGCEDIGFGVDSSTKPFGQESGKVRSLYVSSTHRQRASVIGLEGSEQQLAVDVVIDGEPKAAVLKAKLRLATETEVKRCKARAALREAEKSGEYEKLHGQIVRARQEGVDSSDLDRAAAVLKTLKPDTLEKDEIRTKMSWDNVATHDDPPEVERCEKAECSMGCGSQAGEHLEFIQDAVAQALETVVVPANGDKAQWLFQQLVDTALDVPEECVWRAGGKFILSHADRNQSPAALLPLLVKHGRKELANALGKIIEWTEKHVTCQVSAIQLNLHADHESFHAQHRDIFSVKQKEKAGRDCTCSFKTCIGTMCFSIGSSRQVLLQRMSDNMSSYEACGEQCAGRKERRFFQSGEAMYFNDVWNNNHTHGVPPATHLPCGPRISIALLCAPVPTECSISFF